MKIYCKAYHLKDFRQFSAWHEMPEESETALSGETVVYLWDDFTVVKSPVMTEGVLWNTVTPEWQEFCQTTLRFAVPADLHITSE